MSSRTFGAWSGVLAVVFAAAVVAAAGQEPPQPVLSGAGLPDGPGKDATVRACAPCHEARRAASARLTREGWAAVIESMRLRGAKVSEEDFPVILDYLTTHFLGEAPLPLNLNTGGKNYDESKGVVARNAVHHSRQYPSEIKFTVVRKSVSLR